MTATMVEANGISPFDPPDFDGDDPAALRREIESLRRQVTHLSTFTGENYLSDAQVTELLAPIHSNRVRHKDGAAHLEAYDIKRKLTTVFGFARWSSKVTDSHLLYEEIWTPSDAKDNPRARRVWVGYRVRVCLTVKSPNGTVLAEYEEEACGDAANFPITKRADAHDFAVKTAESQALKRAAVPLGDQFGLGLYNKGSLAPLVRRTLIDPRPPAPLTGNGNAARNTPAAGVDEHITEPLAPEDQPAATGDSDPRIMNSPPATPEPSPVSPSPEGTGDGGPVAGGDPTFAAAYNLYQRAVAVDDSERTPAEKASLLVALVNEATGDKLTKVRVNGTTLRAALMKMLGDARRDHDEARAAQDGGGQS